MSELLAKYSVADLKRALALSDTTATACSLNMGAFQGTQSTCCQQRDPSVASSVALAAAGSVCTQDGNSAAARNSSVALAAAGSGWSTSLTFNVGGDIQCTSTVTFTDPYPCTVDQSNPGCGGGHSQ